MGKTNGERARKAIYDISDIEEHANRPTLAIAKYEVIVTVFATALDKAEKRGRRKERKLWQQRPVVFNLGECDSVEVLEVKQSFDAEKVRTMLDKLLETWYQLGRDNKDNNVTPGQFFDNSQKAYSKRKALHAALGLDG